MKKFLGYGGVGDCFTIILKLLQEKDSYLYTHIEGTKEKLSMCGELLRFYKINHQLIHAPNIRAWWDTHNKNYDKCFNLCAKGYINVPPRSFHWAPCEDEGIKIPFNETAYNKKYKLCVQVNGGLKENNNRRNIKERPVLRYIENNFNKKKDNVVWVGISDFDPPFGESYSGKITLRETLSLIAQSEEFLGFNSILLYWALHNKVKCHLFMDHQGKHDVRIHEEWQRYLHHIDE